MIVPAFDSGQGPAGGSPGTLGLLAPRASAPGPLTPRGSTSSSLSSSSGGTLGVLGPGSERKSSGRATTSSPTIPPPRTTPHPCPGPFDLSSASSEAAAARTPPAGDATPKAPTQPRPHAAPQCSPGTQHEHDTPAPRLQAPSGSSKQVAAGHLPLRWWLPPSPVKPLQSATLGQGAVSAPAGIAAGGPAAAAAAAGPTLATAPAAATAGAASSVNALRWAVALLGGTGTLSLAAAAAAAAVAASAGSQVPSAAALSWWACVPAALALLCLTAVFDATEAGGARAAAAAAQASLQLWHAVFGCPAAALGGNSGASGGSSVAALRPAAPPAGAAAPSRPRNVLVSTQLVSCGHSRSSNPAASSPPATAASPAAIDLAALQATFCERKPGADAAVFGLGGSEAGHLPRSGTGRGRVRRSSSLYASQLRHLTVAVKVGCMGVAWVVRRMHGPLGSPCSTLHACTGSGNMRGHAGRALRM
jgi:hypothetical protein